MGEDGFVGKVVCGVDEGRDLGGLCNIIGSFWWLDELRGDGDVE